ncbi:Vacuolar protein sorting-associated protein [Wickerhamomyces ciferrii]|uniref:Vacuolar protein sorting-associated protein n=1 Tax=Wickerhamomyces ciferrii (strain ATCC 14091 / BCRC 22168 / CBS 111 / JCM 3599 / NBRC 0793 / NRRL Y-1031 F-60-10) TaxID=1206466 RepID=K0KKL5_WICCF|nr:Vacuolar protein sorting-associated protein [Wickerhamomyces ciferrii]CCH43531.1 Vacuolar protein sorting-associated protein [Wickerhamomyces ciferrii]
MSIFYRSPLDLEIRLDCEDSRKRIDVKISQDKKDKLPLYEDGESISGAVTVRVKDGKRVEHTGIKAQLFGSIEIANGQKDDFLCLSHDLASAAELTHSETYNFHFKDVEKRYESYKGKNLSVSYYVKISVLRKSADITKVKKFWVHIYSNPSDLKKSIKLDIGIENCLHIEFEYSKSTYSLKDVLVGRIYFLLTRLKIKHMEISLITRETVGNVPNQLTDSSTIRYEIMDGSPVKGETIPIRLFLGGYDLTPTTKTNMFNVKNYLSLVIIDEDGRRYFKQSEVILFRAK